MERHVIFCSARDCEVAVMILSPDDAEESDNTLMYAACTEIGKSCSGNFCPICAQPMSDPEEEPGRVTARP